MRGGGEFEGATGYTACGNRGRAAVEEVEDEFLKRREGRRKRSRSSRLNESLRRAEKDS